MSIFTHVQSRRPKSSAFNLSHSRKFAFNPGDAVPTLCEEVLPSDRWKYGMTALVRFQPLLSPLMHLVDVYNYSFFVPARLCMTRNKFETFITGGKNGDGKDAQGNTIEIPHIKFNRHSNGGSTALSISYTRLTDTGYPLADFLGVQTGMIENDPTGTFNVNAMPFIAFWKVYCEYFRDPNLMTDWVDECPGIFEATGDITEAVFNAISGIDVPGIFDFFSLPKVCWEKDYFTSALPFAQRGAPVETPLTGTATVSYKPIANLIKPATGAAGDLRGGTGANAPLVFAEEGGGPNTQIGLDNIDEVTLETGGFTINQLRLATRLQEYLEKMARGGSRYIEQMKQLFGVKSSDARLQRTEFLGGGKIPVNISEVLQTSETATTPLAEMAGHGVSAGNVNNFNRFFEEHGFVISIMFVRPRTAYQQGLRRVFTQRFDKLDWAVPTFAHLGEQEVKQKELYFTSDPANDEDVFGYQSRYAEYKYIPSTVHGEFRNNLDFWHWGRIFDDSPTLSQGFVESDPDPRVFNVTGGSTHKLYAIVSNRITAIRPLPYFGEPTL